MGATAKVFGNPQHPYTQMLLASVPQLHRKWAEIEADLLATPTETDGQRRPISHVDTIAAVELDALDSALVEFESDHFVRRSGALAREAGRRHDGNGDVTTPAGKSGAPGVKIAGVGDLPAIPWEDRPAGHSRPVWRYSKNPVIPPRPAVPDLGNSIFNSAVVPFEGGFAGVFRCDDWTRQMQLHRGFSRDGLAWKLAPQPISVPVRGPRDRRVRLRLRPTRGLDRRPLLRDLV